MSDKSELVLSPSQGVQQLAFLETEYARRRDHYQRAGELIISVSQFLEAHSPTFRADREEILEHIRVTTSLAWSLSIIELYPRLQEVWSEVNRLTFPRSGRPRTDPFAEIIFKLDTWHGEYTQAADRYEAAVIIIVEVSEFIRGLSENFIKTPTKTRLRNLIKATDDRRRIELDPVVNILTAVQRYYRRAPQQSGPKTYYVSAIGVTILQQAYSNRSARDPLTVFDMKVRGEGRRVLTAVQNTLRALWYWRYDQNIPGFREHPPEIAQLGEQLGVKDSATWKWILDKAKAGAILAEHIARNYLQPPSENK